MGSPSQHLPVAEGERTQTRSRRQMRRPNLIVGLVLFGQVSTTVAEEEAPVTSPSENMTAPAEAALAPAVAGSPAKNFLLGVAFLPVLFGKVATSPSSGSDTSSN